MNNATSVIAQALPILFIIFILVIGYLRNRAADQLRARGIKWLQAMRSLIAHIQWHRGLSASSYSEDSFFSGQIENIQTQVSRDFEHICQIGDWVSNHTEWQAITQHWARLVGNADNLPITSNFEQHNRLIANIMIFIDDMTVAHRLHTSSHKYIESWRELLSLSELIGQARGIGTSISVRNKAVSSTVLEGANKKLEALSQEIFETLEKPQCKKVLEDEELQCILDFLIYINKNVLMENPAISSTQFFSRSTETLNVLFEKMDDHLQMIHKLISSP